jgi:bifunctional DNA-binding transcriptional regulator/antitoxin component of YhaV-PrlF toxin-antitoxin module
MNFPATVLLAGKTATGIRVPPKVVAGLGSSKKPAVRVTINGYTYRTTVATMNGEFMIPVSGEIREAAGVQAGDKLDVNIELDTEKREVTIPPDFAAALKRDAAANKFFAGLSYSNRRAIVGSIEGAKTDETRQRRITKAVEKLRAERI